MSKHLNFQSKENRNKEYNKLKGLGYKVRKSSIRNQCLHPQYIQDYPIELTDKDKGFGNTLYKTYFACIYQIIIEEYPNDIWGD